MCAYIYVHARSNSFDELLSVLEEVTVNIPQGFLDMLVLLAIANLSEQFHRLPCILACLVSI